MTEVGKFFLNKTNKRLTVVLVGYMVLHCITHIACFPNFVVKKLISEPQSKGSSIERVSLALFKIHPNIY